MLCALLVLAGTALGGARIAAIDALASRAPPGTRIDAYAELLERPRPSPAGARAAVEISSGPARGVRLLARVGRGARWPAGADPGAEVALRGRVRAPPHSRPGRDFDYVAWLRRQGIAAELGLTEVRPTGRRRGGLAGALDAMRARAERAMTAGVGEREAALVRGMVLGQDERIDEPTRDDWRASGLAHLLAVSGQNVMLLGALAFPLLTLAGLRSHGRTAAMIALIAIYVPLAGAGPSIQRAGVMGAAGLVALSVGRPASRWYALLLAAATTLALNPLAAGDPGWQLSFAAVAGILLLAGPIARPLSALPRLLALGVAITFAATLATAPLLAFHFGAVPAWSLAANVAALPAVAPVMWIGMLQAALAQLEPFSGPLAGIAASAAETLGAGSGALAAYLNGVARRFAEAPGALLELPLDTPAKLAAVYAALAGAVVGVCALARRAEPAARERTAAWRRVPRGTRLAAVALVAAAAALALQTLLAPPAPPSAVTVSFLDVGQGDATLVQHPDGAAILFDGGPPEGRVARLLRAAGVRRLSAVVATHQSRDHQGGLREVIERFPVELLLDGGDGTRDPDYLAVRAAADRRGVRRVPATAGLALRAGGLHLRVLSPRPRPPGPPPDDPNDRAVVAVVSAGTFDLFLSADAESPSLVPLALPDVEAMKVPHHGSADPGLGDVLRRLRPQVAAIEVGAENTYGHPHPQTLAALEAAVPHVYRTDRHGTVTLTVDGRGRLRVRTERGGG